MHVVLHLSKFYDWVPIPRRRTPVAFAQWLIQVARGARHDMRASA
jgi:hypothetical protein